jgi:hypothetical protein
VGLRLCLQATVKQQFYCRWLTDGLQVTVLP